MLRDVTVDLSRLDPKAARKQVEAAIGKALRRWIDGGGASITDTAACLGMQRKEVYDLIEGVRSAKLAWLFLLPLSVQRVAVAEIAASLGYDLRPHVSDEPGERTGVELVHEALDAIRLATEHDADGVISEAEARAELHELDELEQAIAARRARLRMALGATARA